MQRVVAMFLWLGGTLGASSPALAQQLAGGATEMVPSRAVLQVTAALVPVPDSVRHRVGYQQWKGAAIGGSLGALAGLALALAAHGQCADCRSNSPRVAKVSLLGAGLGGAFGFLVGLASPRYRWVRAGKQ
jgi:hypothetical protein